MALPLRRLLASSVLRPVAMPEASWRLRAAGMHTSTVTHQQHDDHRSPRFVYQHEHVPLSRPHKAALTLGSLFASLYNPARGDMIALLSELSGEPSLPRLRAMMLESDEGRALLMQRPVINTQSVSMAYLHSLPDDTFGKQYWRWLRWCNVGPDTRAKVRFVEDPELAYVMQRYRECHDFYHVMCLMPVSHLGETVVKMFEASHMGLPVAYLSSLAGPLRLSAEERSMLFGDGGLAAWAWRMGKKCKPLIGVRWEEHWERNFDELRASLGFDEAPPAELRFAGRTRADISDTSAAATTSSRFRGKSRGRWPSKVIEHVGSQGL